MNHFSKSITPLLLLMLALMAASVSAEVSTGNSKIHALYIGVLDHDPGIWSTSEKESGTDLNVEVVFNKPLATFGRTTLRPTLGGTFNNTGDTSQIYAGIEWNRPFGKNDKWFFNWNFGLALHNGKQDTTNENKKDLGSSWLFRNAFELGYTFGKRHSLSLMFDHISNGGFASPNDGLDTTGVRYRLNL